ncbi:hypothetical protein [Sphingorhabdus sp.]|jgi:hypothetical protein|uniref:hypothetical protein n=1 Tax=Sphingorhabdus sp. TaxID=1902408 RepID=UPI0035B39B2A
MGQQIALQGKQSLVIGRSSRQRAVFQFRGLQSWEMLADKTCGILVADCDCRGPLETLVGVEKVEPGVPAFIDPKALHY